jgi:hypothetical protein
MRPIEEFHQLGILDLLRVKLDLQRLCVPRLACADFFVAWVLRGLFAASVADIGLDDAFVFRGRAKVL